MLFEDITGTVINQRYLIISILGKGGNGITYTATDLTTQETVALKAVSLKEVNNWKQIELVAREAEVLKKLDHPAIPKYLDYFSIDTANDKSFYIVQELILGKSLDQMKKVVFLYLLINILIV